MKRFFVFLMVFLFVGLTGCIPAQKQGAKASKSSFEKMTEEELEEELAQNYKAYNAGKITYREARDTLSDIRETDILSKKKTNLAKEKLEALKLSKANYDSAEEYMRKQEYLSAIEMYSQVVEEDALYQQALKNIEKARQEYVNQIMQVSSLYYAQKDFQTAINILASGNDSMGGDAEVLSQIERYRAEYVSDSLQRAREAFDANGDREEAVAILQATQDYLPYWNQDLQDAMDQYRSYPSSEPAAEALPAEPSFPAEPQLRSLTVPEKTYYSMDVDPVYVGETVTIPEEPVVSYAGYLANDDEKNTYTYTAPRDGRYRFQLENVNAKATFRVLAWDANDHYLMDTYSGGSYVDLQAGETYTIQVRQYLGASGYTLNIYAQKETTDITYVTTVNDQVSFEDQKNVYRFTAPIDGRYRFDLTETKATTSFRLMLWDRLDSNIVDTYSGGAYVDLKAGETYELQVRQYSGLGSYRMLVYRQKPTLDITGYDTVNDSIQYEDQKNVYRFTAPIDGRYRFDLTETKANTSFRLMLWDRLDYNQMDTYSGGAYVVLEAGETYQLQVRQYSGLGSYRMRIGYQKEPVDISDVDIVYDSITFEDQKNVYLFTPSQTGTYTFTLGDSSCRFRLMAWDKYETNILETTSGSGSILLEAGETYEIQVRQSTGYSSYSLRIE